MKNTRAVSIIIESGKVLLMHRIKNGNDYNVFPGGGVEEDETVEEALLREVKEETSLDVVIDKLLYHHLYDNGHEQFFYLCKYVSGGLALGGEEAQKCCEENYYEHVWVEIDKIKDKLIYPLEIRDWLAEDFKKGFTGNPRSAEIKISDLRQSL